MKKAAISILFVVFHLAALAQFMENNAIRDAQNAIMELRFSDAQNLLQAEADRHKNNRFVPYLQSNMAFLAQFLSNNPKTLDSTVARLSNQLKEVEKSEDKNNLYYHYCLAEINFELGALYLQNGSNWKAAWSMLEALDQIQENNRAPSEFLPQQFMSGILNVTMGSLPKRYKVMARLLGYTGDVATGIEEMHRSTQTEQTPYVGFKKKFVFAYGYTRTVLFESDTMQVWDLDSTYKTSPLLLYIQARMYTNRGQNEQIITLLQSDTLENRYPFVYLNYMLGKAKLNRLDEDADVPFKKFLNEFNGQNAVKAANRYLSWFYFLKGDKRLAQVYRTKVFEEGQTSVGTDQMAVFDAKLDYHEQLIKARLYFDGGYYRQALQQLNLDEKDLKTDDLKMEYHYRHGRILQKLEQDSQAIEAFEKVFDFNDSNAKRLFAANAALQLGTLYEENGLPKKAIAFYKRAIGYEDFPFEDGTQQKAKAGLQRVELKYNK